jgi:hypothetical protein
VLNASTQTEPLEFDGLAPLQLRAALWVVGGLMEDVSKLDLNSERK